MSKSKRVLKEPLKSIGAQDILKLEYSHCGVIRKEGQLERKIKRVSSVKWRQYFVVIAQGCAYIFNDEAATSPKKCFSLRPFDKIERFAVEGASYMNFCFRLVSVYEDDKEKTINFACSDDNQRKEWMQHFYLEIRKANTLETDVPTETYGEIEQNIHETVPPQKQRSLPSIPSIPSIPTTECESDDDDGDYDKVDVKVKDSTKRYSKDPTGRTLPPIPKSQSHDIPKSQPRSVDADRGPESTTKQKSSSPDNTVQSPGFEKTEKGPEWATKKKEKPPVAPKPIRLQKTEPLYGNIPRGYGNMDLRNMPEDEEESPSESYDDVIQQIPVFDGESSEASKVIEVADDGVFLIRKGSTTPYVLVVKIGTCKMYRIFQNDDGSGLRIVKESEDGPKFDSLFGLVEFYIKNNLPNTNTKLTRQYVQK